MILLMLLMVSRSCQWSWAYRDTGWNEALLLLALRACCVAGLTLAHWKLIFVKGPCFLFYKSSGLYVVFSWILLIPCHLFPCCFLLAWNQPFNTGLHSFSSHSVEICASFFLSVFFLFLFCLWLPHSIFSFLVLSMDLIASLKCQLDFFYRVRIVDREVLLHTGVETELKWRGFRVTTQSTDCV